MTASPLAQTTADRRFLVLLGRPVQQPQPLGDYMPARRVGNVVYLSTTPAKTGRSVTYPGVVGRDLDVAAATLSARWAALTLLEYLWNELGGTFAPVRQFVSLTGYVASADGFHDQADVLNGASAVLIEVFGAEIGKPSRSAIGVRHMPRNASVAVGGLVEIAA